MFSKGFTVAILLIGFVLVANVRCAPEQVRIVWIFEKLMCAVWKDTKVTSFFSVWIEIIAGWTRKPSNPSKCAISKKNVKNIKYWLIINLCLYSIGSSSNSRTTINPRCARSKLNSRCRRLQKCGKSKFVQTISVKSNPLFRLSPSFKSYREAV